MSEKVDFGGKPRMNSVRDDVMSEKATLEQMRCTCIH